MRASPATVSRSATSGCSVFALLRKAALISSAVADGFTCDLDDGQDQYASVADWEWESERGARWQWWYQASLGGSIRLADALQVLGAGEVEVYDAYPESFGNDLVIARITKDRPTPKQYPRDPGMAKKSPL